jgi:hypothetical protein
VVIAGILFHARNFAVFVGAFFGVTVAIEGLLVHTSIVAGEPAILEHIGRYFGRSSKPMIRRLGLLVLQAAAKIPLWAGGTVLPKSASAVSKAELPPTSAQDVLDVESCSPISTVALAMDTGPRAELARAIVVSRATALAGIHEEEAEFWRAAQVVLEQAYGLDIDPLHRRMLRKGMFEWVGQAIEAAAAEPGDRPGELEYQRSGFDTFDSLTLAFIAATQTDRNKNILAREALWRRQQASKHIPPKHVPGMDGNILTNARTLKMMKPRTFLS